MVRGQPGGWLRAGLERGGSQGKSRVRRGGARRQRPRGGQGSGSCSPATPAAHGGPQPAGGGRGPAESLRTVDAAPGTAPLRVMTAPLSRPGVARGTHGLAPIPYVLSLPGVTDSETSPVPAPGRDSARLSARGVCPTVPPPCHPSPAASVLLTPRASFQFAPHGRERGGRRSRGGQAGAGQEGPEWPAGRSQGLGGNRAAGQEAQEQRGRGAAQEAAQAEDRAARGLFGEGLPRHAGEGPGPAPASRGTSVWLRSGLRSDDCPARWPQATAENPLSQVSGSRQARLGFASKQL